MWVQPIRADFAFEGTRITFQSSSRAIVAFVKGDRALNAHCNSRSIHLKFVGVELRNKSSELFPSFIVYFFEVLILKPKKLSERPVFNSIVFLGLYLF